MSKILTVSSSVQKAVLETVLIREITSGFWLGARPADHASAWVGVEIVVGDTYGTDGFSVPRNYNFVNPDFFKKNEAELLAAARTVNSTITVKQLKKQLINLNQILGGRVTVSGGSVTKLPRGRRIGEELQADSSTTRPTVRKVAANFIEPQGTETSTAVTTPSSVTAA